MSEIKELTNKIIEFRDKRDWKQFHNPKDMAISLVLEATELMEHFQWLNSKEMEIHTREHKEELAEELSDILYWVLLISHDFNIDIKTAFFKKLNKQIKKYPVKKSKGKHTKYNKL